MSPASWQVKQSAPPFSVTAKGSADPAAAWHASHCVPATGACTLVLRSLACDELCGLWQTVQEAFSTG
jgi:hypothetical protein